MRRLLLLLLLALLPLAAPASAAAPDFALLDHHGRAVTAQDFAGRPMLVYFGYTFCPDFCPTSLAAIGRALELLDEAETARVAPLFVTLDPERDTPANLAGADLSDGNLHVANLQRSNLAKANLTRVQMFAASLTGANLSEANLSGANLTRVDLTGADLRGARLDGATMIAVKLGGAKWTDGRVCADGSVETCR
ncbi:MAG: SCO family protein [Alphaproteobacteria bacterium]|nr:SCO family protein [Alphaproteobacteria bacterium]